MEYGAYCEIHDGMYGIHMEYMESMWNVWNVWNPCRIHSIPLDSSGIFHME